MSAASAIRLQDVHAAGAEQAPAARAAPAAAIKLRIEALQKRYGKVVALEPTSLDVRAGEFMTLLGPSGSGKTTLLMAIAGLVQADGGRILIDGHDSTDRPPYERDIGMVFQNYALFPHLTIFENIAFSLRVRRVAEGEIGRRVAHALALVHLDHVADRFPRELSGGQQQRIAIARSIVYEPSIVLMDEPLGALDKRLREHMQLEIKRLHRQLGVTIIYVTHDQEEALSMSDRICLMDQGRIVQLEAPQALYFSPRTRFAASFLGEANLLEASRMSCGTVRAAGMPIRVNGAMAGGGDALLVLVRPECFVLGDQGAPYNRLPARIADVTMLGPMTRLDVVSGDGTKLVAKLPTSRMLARLAIGDDIVLSFLPEDAVVIPEAA